MPSYNRHRVSLQRNALVVRLQPFHTNLNKRVVRTPKVYFPLGV